MTEFTISKKAFTDFLDTFGKGLEDIALRVQESGITASVGTMTHYIKRDASADVVEEGTMHIGNLDKVRTFMKSSGGDDITLDQQSTSGMLNGICANSKLQLPGTNYIKSQREVHLIEKLISESEAADWKHWVGDKLTCHATISSVHLRPVANMAKVVGDKLTCKARFDAMDMEMVFHAGKATSGKMFVRVPIHDSWGPDMGVESTFAHWLPELMGTVPNGDVKVHTGESTVLVITQEDTGYLLVVMDQQFEED